MLGDWFRLVFLEGAYLSLGGMGVVAALILIIVLRVLLPETERKQIRIPILLLFGNLAIVIFRSLVALPDGFDKPIGAIALVLLLACLGRCSFLLVVDYLIGRRLARPLPKIFRDIIQAVVYFGVAFLTLPYFGVEPGSLLTTSALITAVIGLSLQETLGNLFAGLAIQAQRPFEVGDWIKFDMDQGLTGRVTDPRDLDMACPAVEMPDAFAVDDSMVEPPAEDPASVEVVRGPNIGEPPAGDPLPESLDGTAAIKVGDKITTDHIMPAGARMKYRSNVPKYAEFLFETVDPAFHDRAAELKAAGVDYQDCAVVVDGNLITSRRPADLPAFMQAIFKALGLD